MRVSSFGKGVFFAALSYLLWGILPLYWKALSAVNSLHILAFRIIFSLLLVGFLLAMQKSTAWIACFKEKKKGGLLILASVTISFNWGLYIWAVNSGHTIETSLGYYINPLVSVVFALLFFKEKLRPLQWAAFGIAMLGVLILTALSGAPPWISLGLALSFGLYGVLKKVINIPALESLGAETLAASPLGLLLLVTRFEVAPNGKTAPIFGLQGISYLAELPVHSWLLLLCCGAITALPLYFFARGARLLPLSTLGFIQFISPTLQFLAGFFIFGEYFPVQNFAAIGCIWGAAILYIVSQFQKE
ncbi:transporter [Spirochaetia bacterium]|nr:transporter [Spirochaetia bacterium]